MSEDNRSNDLSEQLYNAVNNINIDINEIKELLSRGASLSWKDSNRNTVLHCVARYSNFECVQLFVEKGAKVDVKNNDGRTSLHFAAMGGRYECCEYLVNQGANINTVDNYGQSPLHSAAEIGVLKICEFLIRHEAEINAIGEDGNTLLHCAVRSGNLECCEFFLNLGIDINVVNASGDTPLHKAISYDNIDCCEFLVGHGADVNIKNLDGLTPLLVSLRTCYWLYDEKLRIFKSLFQCGANLYELPINMNRDEDKQRYNSLQICWKFWTKQQYNKQDLIDIPLEVFKRGSEAIEIYFQEIEKSHHQIYRSRVCIVGPSGWGKTSLVQSLISGVPKQVSTDNRTIGIDQFEWNFNIFKKNIDWNTGSNNIESNNLDEARNIEYHQVNFWDFAGQDVYKGTHSIFFSSSRTLFLICVDLELYYPDIENNRTTASDEILRWLRLVFAKQPNAKLVFVGTKADLVDKFAIEDIKFDLSECVGGWCDKYSDDIENRNRQVLLSDNGILQYDLQPLQSQLKKVKDAVNGNWVITSSKDEEVLKAARAGIQTQIRDSNLGIIMPDSYITVLDYLYQLRKDARPKKGITELENTHNSSSAILVNSHNIEGISQLDIIFCSQHDLKRRIRRNVRVGDNNDIQNDSDVQEINRVLNEILELFHDLGEILLFNNIILNRKKGVIIVDPGLMIDLVREIVRHDLCQYLEQCNAVTHLEPSDWKEQLKNGIVYHTILERLPIWSSLTKAQKLVAKELLHKCQFLHPVGNIQLDPETNLVVPALWLLNQDVDSRASSMEESIAGRYEDTHDITHICWEYKFSVNTLPESFFELFIVESYHCDMERNVKPNCLEVWAGDTSSLGLVTFSLSDSSHSIIRIEVASNMQDMALQLLQYMLSAIENLLREYPGVSKSPYYVELCSNGLRKRHAVNGTFLAGRFCLRAKYNFLDENLFLWYYKLFSTDQKALQELLNMCEQKKIFQREKEDKERMNPLFEKLRVLCKGEKNRQLPAVWTAELSYSENKLYIRLLSDISGKCFHDPFVLILPSRLLAIYINKLKIGENVLSIVTPDAIPWEYLDLVNWRNKLKEICNLIFGCDLQMYGIIDTDRESCMGPEESKLLLMGLLEACYPGFTLDQIPQISRLVCGIVNDTKHCIWARKDEFVQFGGKITRL